VHDIVHEAFLQAFVVQNRLRDLDRFGAWLMKVSRAAARERAWARRAGAQRRRS